MQYAGIRDNTMLLELGHWEIPGHMMMMMTFDTYEDDDDGDYDDGD